MTERRTDIVFYKQISRFAFELGLNCRNQPTVRELSGRYYLACNTAV